MKNWIALLAITIGLFGASCKREFLDVSKKKYRAISTPVSLKQNCIEDIFGKWELISATDSAGNPQFITPDTIRFGSDTTEWSWINSMVPGAKFYNSYSSSSWSDEFPTSVYAVECENNRIHIGYMSCGIFLVTYKITQLSNTVFEIEYDPTYPGNPGYWGAYRFTYHRV